jgi:hypothetical protein
LFQSIDKMKELSWSNIHLKNIEPNILKEVVEQTNKDFNEQSLQKVAEGSVLSDVKSSLKLYLLDMNKRSEDLQQLLYRIDVPEKEVEKVIAIRDLDTLCGELAELILKRELQKVLIRRHFKGLD